jgi:hypothetical protein
MTRMALVAAVVTTVLAAPLLHAGTPVRYGDAKAELTVSAVSDHTLQFVLAPLDDKDNPRVVLD